MHYHLIVVMRPEDSLDDILAKYDENLEVPGRYGDLVSDDDKNFILNYYKKEHKINENATFDECYQKFGNAWNSNSYRKKLSDGQWYHWYTYNPDGRYDWYQVGGRWPGTFRLKENSSTEPDSLYYLCYLSKKDMDELLKQNPRPADKAPKGDIDNLEEIVAYDILIDDEWITLDGEKIYPYVKDLPDDCILVSVDYHN